MSGFPILDLVVGMIFIYFILSIISSSAVGIILNLLQARSKLLGKWLTSIFDKDYTRPDGTVVKLGQAIMDHCATTALTKNGVAPSYIDAKNFTLALLEKISYNPQNPKSIAKNVNDVITALENTNLLSTELQRAVLGYAYEARDTYQAIDKKIVTDIEYFRAKVENWYDTNMDRLTDAFQKRYARPATLVVAIVTALALNADSVAIAKYLYNNPEARTRLAAKAFETGTDERIKEQMDTLKLRLQGDPVQMQTFTQLEDSIKSKLKTINAAQAALKEDIPLGWKRDGSKIGIWDVLAKLVGLLATVLAIFMGAPFWFDILNKVANVRGAGPKPATSADDEKR